VTNPLMNRAELAYFFKGIGCAMKNEMRSFTDIQYYNFVLVDIITTIFYNYIKDKEKERFLANLLAIHNSIKDYAMKKHPDVKEDKKLVKKMVKKGCMK
jgi:hypothetical protein